MISVSGFRKLVTSVLSALRMASCWSALSSTFKLPNPHVFHGLLRTLYFQRPLRSVTMNSSENAFSDAPSQNSLIKSDKLFGIRFGKRSSAAQLMARLTTLLLPAPIPIYLPISQCEQQLLPTNPPKADRNDPARSSITTTLHQSIVSQKLSTQLKVRLRSHLWRPPAA